MADPFPGNIIPAGMINPVARAALEYFGMPKTAGAADGTGNFQNPSLPETIKYATNTIRVDHNLTQKQRIYGRFSWYDRNSNYNNYFDNLSTGEWFKFISRQFAFDHVYMLDSTTVLNLRYGYNYFVRGTDTNPGNHGFDLTSLGFPASYNSAIPDDIRRFPRFDITGYQGTGFGGEYRPNATNSFIATVNKSMGAHSLRTGVEYRQYAETSEFFANNQTGQFNFDSTWTRGPLDNSPTAPNQLGQSFASFLLGLPASGSVAIQPSYDEASSTWGFYIQDDWKAGDRLTLNLGLRYEYETALVEADNRSVRGFDYGAAQPMEAAARAALNSAATGVPLDQFHVQGGLTFAGVNGEPRGLYETPKNNFMPRVGGTYRINDKTILRGGYGVFYGFLGQRRGDVITTGFSSTTTMVPSLDNGLTFIETLSNPFQGGIQQPQGSAQGIQTFLGQSITFFDPEPESPRMQRFQIGIQRELPGQMVFEASYVGNRGSDIQTTRNINSTPLQYLSTSPTRDQATIDYLSANVPNPFFGLMPVTAGTVFRSATIARERLLRPYPHFDAVNTTTNEGKSWYNSLQTGLQKRFSRGYTIGLNYTFSRFEEATEFLNGADAAPTKMISSQDVPHRLSVSGIYEIPDRPRAALRLEHEPGPRPRGRRMAVPGDLHLSVGIPGRQLRQPALHRQLRRHRAVRRRADDRPLVQHRRGVQQGHRAAARLERADVPDALRLGADRQRQQRRPVGDQERHARQGADAAVPLRVAECAQSPALPDTDRQQPDAHQRAVRRDRRVDAAELRAPHAGDD